MTYLTAANDISAFTAVLWCFYPVALLVGVELLLRAINDNDDDDRDGGKMIPAMSPSAWQGVEIPIYYTEYFYLVMPHIAFIATLAVYTYFNVGQYILQ